tara:strand:+ start:161 stop:790 length:630 start_codon:yes stop_codon:yes gene_type:complete
MNKPAEKNNLIYKIFNLPIIYNLYQFIIFRSNSKVNIFSNYMVVEENDFVLDIGCGPGNYRQLIKSKNYFGIDINCESIKKAEKLFPNDSFACLPVQELSNKFDKKFDKVILFGLLHHLSDTDVVKLFQDLREVVTPDTKIFCLDTSFSRNQNLFSKIMARLDKGNFVRFPDELEKLFDTKFYNIDIKMFDNLLRVPCYHSFVKLSLNQ